jgi:type II secretory pathway component GspD/PulD (secretin)
MDITLRNNALIVIPVLGKEVSLGAGAGLYGLRTESYRDQRTVNVVQQDPVYWDRTQTVRQTVEVDVGSTTLIGGGLQVSASVPTFRDIPLVGSLFAGRSLNESSTELIILISARITLDRE